MKIIGILLMVIGIVFGTWELQHHFSNSLLSAAADVITASLVMSGVVFFIIGDKIKKL